MHPDGSRLQIEFALAGQHCTVEAVTVSCQGVNAQHHTAAIAEGADADAGAEVGAATEAGAAIEAGAEVEVGVEAEAAAEVGI